MVTMVGVYYKGRLMYVFESESPRLTWDGARRLIRKTIDAQSVTQWRWVREHDGRIAYVNGDFRCAMLGLPSEESLPQDGPDWTVSRAVLP